jgi:hypothetical protein
MVFSLRIKQIKTNVQEITDHRDGEYPFHWFTAGYKFHYYLKSLRLPILKMDLLWGFYEKDKELSSDK